MSSIEIIKAYQKTTAMVDKIASDLITIIQIGDDVKGKIQKLLTTVQELYSAQEQINPSLRMQIRGRLQELLKNLQSNNMCTPINKLHDVNEETLILAAESIEEGLQEIIPQEFNDPDQPD